MTFDEFVGGMLIDPKQTCSVLRGQIPVVLGESYSVTRVRVEEYFRDVREWCNKSPGSINVKIPGEDNQNG